MVTVRTATLKLFQRYLELMQDCVDEDKNTVDPISYNNLRWLSNTAIENIEVYPVDKLSRWLGFVQGVLTIKGVITVEGERDYSRPLFHEAYRNEGTAIPPTRNISNKE